MCACSIPGCRRNHRDSDSDDEDSGDRSQKMSGDEGANEIAEQERRRLRTHNLSVFDPPPSRCDLLRSKISKSINTLYMFWTRLRNDRYQWALFKTILWFAVGLKLFHDLARHAKVTPVLGGISKGRRKNESHQSGPWTIFQSEEDEFSEECGEWL